MRKRRNLDEKHTLVCTPHFPVTFKPKGGRRALLGIGGNLGDVARRFEHLFYFFARSPLIRVIETSPMFVNPPFGYTKQGDFTNALLWVETQLTAKMLLRYVLAVERRFGRTRSFQDAPRTLDIDIIFYENVTMDTKTLTLPHPGWMQRTSVLTPLSYMKGRT